MGFFRKAKTQAKKTARNVILLLIGACLGGLVIAGAGLYYFRESLIRAIVLPRISHVTGFKADAESIQHEFPLRLTLTNVTLENPEGYKPKIFATGPYFYIDIDLESLIEGKIFRIREWKIVISKLNLERNKEGVINGMLLKAIKNFMSGKAPGEPGGGYSTQSSMDFFMDRLELRVDAINYRDLTGVVPRKILKKLKLDTHVYENTEEFGKLIDRIEADVMKQIDLGKRVEMSPFYLERSLKKAADTVVGTTEMLAEGAGKMVKTTAVTAPAEIFKTTAEMMGFKQESKNTKEEVLKEGSQEYSKIASISGAAADPEIEKIINPSAAEPHPLLNPSPSPIPSLSPEAS